MVGFAYMAISNVNALNAKRPREYHAASSSGGGGGGGDEKKSMLYIYTSSTRTQDVFIPLLMILLAAVKYCAFSV